ncbi:MAG TPA: DMT family transporter [Aquifex aeolicus]|uniref:DMT family transporter n=1 Tax=Aquifex aeolicus TaxID=63363 RepID=A0A9D0YPJ3_AQUAO|nr:DMT family transporter [Aquificales bacterium]HIP86678.1 DMT family transporter [Aquifex sp.]HIP98234.1 DMT family transporter [Aquifex aeolicus]HIQ26596.1 DMT family transporter [Aquifex aeolicus]
MSERFYAYLSALASSVFYSLNQIFNKRVTLALGTLPALVIVYAFLTLFDFLFCYLFGSFYIKDIGVLLEIVFVSLIGAVAILTLFESFRYLPIGISITLANLSPVFLTLFVFLTTGKFPPLEKLLLIALILFSVFLITFEGKGGKRLAYLLPLVTAVGWAITGLEFFRLLNIHKIDPFGVAFYTSLYMFSVFLAVFLAVSNNKIRLLKKMFRFKKIFLWSLAGGFLTSLGFIFAILSFKWIEVTEAPVIEAIFTLSTPLSALFSYLLLKEKLSLRQTVGIAISFLALFMFFLSG